MFNTKTLYYNVNVSITLPISCVCHQVAATVKNMCVRATQHGQALDASTQTVLERPTATNKAHAMPPCPHLSASVTMAGWDTNVHWSVAMVTRNPQEVTTACVMRVG